MQMPPLETDRLRVRPFVREDREACERLFQTVWGHGVRDDWLEWAIRNSGELAQMYQPPYGDRAIIRRETGELIGSVGVVPSFGPFGTLPGFDPDPTSAAAKRFMPEVGLYWCLLPEQRGKGYATEAARVVIDFAFRELNLRRIIATTEYENEASQAVMRRLGMRLERNPFPEPVWFQVVGVLENTREDGQ